MSLYRNSRYKSFNFFVDLIGVTSFLVIGAFGYWVTSDPVRLLIPKHPMLSMGDWENSYSGHEARIIESRNWYEERTLIVRLKSDKDENRDDAEIVQTAVWFADSNQAANMWNRYQYRNNLDLISEKFISKSNPASRLFCRDDLEIFTASCYYYAYRGHWFTEVKLSSRSSKYLSMPEVQKVIDTVDQLLMSVSDEVITESLPIQSGSPVPPYIIAITATSLLTLTPDPQVTPNPLFIPTISPSGVPTIVALISCPPLQAGENRTIGKGTFIFGNVDIEGIEKIEPLEDDIATIIYFQRNATITATGETRCYTGDESLISHVIQNELINKCSSSCTSIRFIYIGQNGHYIEIYK